MEGKPEISTKKLIEAVKQRTALYSKENPNYHNHGKYKGQLWKEVCREVFTDWGSLSPRRKLEYAHDLQRRWKNIRTCFTRELSLQKKESKSKDNGNDTDYRKRRKYVYFDQLTFLINPEEVPEAPELKVSIDEDSNDPLEAEMFNLESEESAYEDNSSRNLTNHHYVEIDEDPYPQNMYHRDDNIKQEVLQMMGDMKKDETEDEDRQFVLSIVPALRKLNEKQKYDAKIEILKVLKKISTGEDF